MVAGVFAVVLFFVFAIVTRLVGEEAKDRLRDVPGIVLEVALLALPRDERTDARQEALGELFEILEGKDARPITRLFVGVRYSGGLFWAWAPQIELTGRRGHGVGVALAAVSPLPVTAIAYVISGLISGVWSLDGTAVLWLGVGISYASSAQFTFAMLESKTTLGQRTWATLKCTVVPVVVWAGVLAAVGLGAAVVALIGPDATIAVVVGGFIGGVAGLVAVLACWETRPIRMARRQGVTLWAKVGPLAARRETT